MFYKIIVYFNNKYTMYKNYNYVFLKFLYLYFVYTFCVYRVLIQFKNVIQSRMFYTFFSKILLLYNRV